MNNKETTTSTLLNTFRAACRKENREFTHKEFVENGIKGGFGRTFINALLQALVKKKYIIKEDTRYQWTPLYKNESRLEEFGAINPNSWESLFRDARNTIAAYNRNWNRNHSAKNKEEKSENPVKEESLTFTKVLEFIKINHPNVKVIERVELADGSEYIKEY